MKNANLAHIGTNELVSIGKRFVDVPAKVDTGADSSAIWASNIKVRRDGTLTFSLFGEGSPYYTGKIFRRTDFNVVMVRSAMGHEQIRYRTHFKIKLAGRTINALFNLADRSQQNFPVLIGRRTIAGKFVVDVTKRALTITKNPKTAKLNRKLAKRPVQLPQKICPA